LLLHVVLRPGAAAVLAMQQLIDISHSLGPQQQTHHMLLQRVIGTDGQTDAMPFYRLLCRQCQ